MPDYMGYRDNSLDFLKRHGIAVGDTVHITADITYTGIIMPRYEHSDDRHIVLKLASGYNVGLETDYIVGVKKIQSKEKQSEMQDAPKFAEGLPNILLLSTGGTIASRVDYRTGAVTPVLTAEELSASVPELAEIANIEAKVVLSEYSENLQPEHWIQIANQIAQCTREKYTGVIIAHGTDTLHYTSAFLSFALAGFPIPVVLVGSQRSSDRASSDAVLNLIGAARFIVECGVAGIYIAMHQDENDISVACHLGTRVRKNHTSKRGAFQTIGGSPAFIITDEHIDKNISASFFQTTNFEPRIKLDSRVALVKYHPGLDPALLEQIIGMGYKGIIFEGTGLGHVGDTLYNTIRMADEKGIFLGMTSQCIDGRVRMTVYESGRDLLELGIVPLEDMIAEVALVKAMWAFGNFQSRDDVKKIMLENIASEMSV